MSRNDGTVLLENAELLWSTNFAGNETTFKPEGYRSFNVALPLDLAKQMADDGWNVKETKEKVVDGEVVDEGGKPFVEVHVDYKYRIKPIVNMIGETSRKRTLLDEETIGMLDDAVIVNVDMKLRPYEYEINGKSGIKAKLKAIYVTIEEDYLDMKYANLDAEPSDG